MRTKTSSEHSEIIQQVAPKGLPNVSSTLPTAKVKGFDTEEYLNVSGSVKYIPLSDKTTYQRTAGDSFSHNKRDYILTFERSGRYQQLNDGKILTSNFRSCK